MKGSKKKVGYKVIAADAKKAPVETSSKPKETKQKEVPHRETCYEILKENGKPMHYKKITEEVLKRNKSVGLTPANSMFARMTTDNKDRFKKLGKGKFGLAEWDKKPVEAIKNAI